MIWPDLVKQSMVVVITILLLLVDQNSSYDPQAYKDRFRVATGNPSHIEKVKRNVIFIVKFLKLYYCLLLANILIITTSFYPNDMLENRIHQMTIQI